MSRRFVIQEDEKGAFALLSARPGESVNDGEVYFHAVELCLSEEWELPKKFIFMWHAIVFREEEKPDPLRFYLDWDDIRSRMEEMDVTHEDWFNLKQAIASAAEKLQGVVTFDDEEERFVLFDVDGIIDFSMGSFLEEVVSQDCILKLI